MKQNAFLKTDMATLKLPVFTMVAAATITNAAIRGPLSRAFWNSQRLPKPEMYRVSQLVIVISTKSRLLNHLYLMPIN
jgi:Holliday junction resolvasome RuvABC ATP-dependent DNA helicase subunit